MNERSDTTITFATIYEPPTAQFIQPLIESVWKTHSEEDYFRINIFRVAVNSPAVSV